LNFVFAQSTNRTSIYIKTESFSSKKTSSQIQNILAQSNASFSVLKSENFGNKKTASSSLIHARIPNQQSLKNFAIQEE
jgi:hypothetical protein